MQRTGLVDGEPGLLGGRCQSCGHVMIPARAICPQCRSTMIESHAIGQAGTAERVTDVLIPIDGVEPPYTISLVRMDEGPVVLARVAGSATKGDRVIVEVDLESDSYWFRAV